MEKEDLLSIEEFEKIDALQSKMRDISPETFDEILNISLNIFPKSKELIYSYFNSLRSMSKSRKKSIDLYSNLAKSVLSECDFLSEEEKQNDQLNIQSKTTKKVEIKSNSQESQANIEKIVHSIQEDDIDQFQSILSHTNLNPNSELTFVTPKSGNDNNKQNNNNNNKRNQKNENKETSYALIEYAAFNSSVKIFKFLLLNLGTEPKLNENLYNNAIKGGNFDIIHLIEKEYPQLIKQSSLYNAISTNQNQIAHYLLENFDFIQLDNKSAVKSVKSFNIEFILKYLNIIKVNETKENIFPLFVEAIKTRQLGLVRFFYSNYPKFIDLNKHFESKSLKRSLAPLIFTIKMKFNEISIYLIHQKSTRLQFFDEEEYEPDALNEAIKTKNHEITAELLKQPSIQINNIDFNYYSPIHYSIFVKDFEIFSMIINTKNSDILLRGGSNETIFHYAAYNSFIEIFDFALKNCPEKFDLKAKNMYDFSIFEAENSGKLRPIHYAGSNGAVDAFKFLFSLDELDKKSLANTGKNALHLACLNGHDNIVEFLLNDPKGFDVFDVNEGDKILYIYNYLIMFYFVFFLSGETPLHLASTNRHKNVVCLLLQVKGIEVNKKDLEGKTPLDLAKERIENPVTEVLESKYKELNLM